MRISLPILATLLVFSSAASCKEKWRCHDYFTKLFNEWKSLVSKTKNGKSLSFNAESFLLSTAERSTLQKDVQSQCKKLKEKNTRMCFTYSFTKKGSKDIKDAMGTKTKNFQYDLDSVQAAAEALKEAFSQGLTDLQSELSKSDTTDIETSLSDVTTALESAVTSISESELAPSKPADENPKKCDSGDRPLTPDQYFGKIFTALSQLSTKSKSKDSPVGKDNADTVFLSTKDRNSVKGDLKNSLKDITALDKVKLCFTYTFTKKGGSSFDTATGMDNKDVAKDSSNLQAALEGIKGAIETGISDIKTALEERGESMTSLEATIDAAFTEVNEKIESMVSNAESTMSGSASGGSGSSGSSLASPCQFHTDHGGLLDFTSATMSYLRSALVAATNEARTKHGVPVLSSDTALDAIAQETAEDHVLQAWETSGKLADHTNNGYGENYFVAEAPNGFTEFPAAIESWYNENTNYDYSKGAASDGKSVIGHFTQLVWKSTTKVGHGIAYNMDCTKVAIVANYDPAGNVAGKYTTNVLQPTSG